MKKYIDIIIIVLLVLTFLTVSFYHINRNQIVVNNMHYKIRLYEDIIRQQFINSYQQIEHDVKFQSQNEEIITFTELTKKDYDCYVRLKKKCCDICVNQVLEILKTFLMQNSDLKVAIISDHESLRKMKALINVHKIKCDYYLCDNLLDSHFENEFEGIYFFKCNKNGQMYNFYTPLYELPDMTKKYFDFLLL